MKTISILGIQMHNITLSEFVTECRSLLQGKKCAHIATVNPEFLVTAHRNPEFHALLSSTYLNVCDGFGIVLCELLCSWTYIHRITGVTLAETICKVCEEEKKSIYFLGGQNVSQSAAESMKKKYPNLIIAGASDMEEVQNIQKKNPVVILVALGSPKQEEWIRDNAHLLPSLRIAVGVGGTFDFWSGKVPRAPKWMQSIGLEWLYRLIRQPYRIRRILRAVFVYPLYRLLWML